MKKLLFTFAICLLIVSMADSQTLTMRNRIDTCAAGAKGGVTSWKPCKMRGIGRSYTFTAIHISGDTMATRFAFTWRDTVAGVADTSAGSWAVGGGIIPYFSTNKVSVTVPNVDQNADTVWIKGGNGTILRMWKF